MHCHQHMGYPITYHPRIADPACFILAGTLFFIHFLLSTRPHYVLTYVYDVLLIYPSVFSRKRFTKSTTPVQALKHCERLLRRLSQHLTFSLPSLPQKRGMGFPPRCLYMSNNVICPSIPSLLNSFLYSFP